MPFSWILEISSKREWVKILAPAKINLFLRVLRKLPSGYHAIRSLMLPISLADEVELAIDPKEHEVKIRCNDPRVPVGKKNLAYKAIHAMEEEGFPIGGATITIHKKIPPGAGLGGGSSDAAAVLKGVNLLRDLNLPRKILCKIGLKIGADVPFFLIEQACLVSGVGEKLEPIPFPRDAWFVIGFPGFEVSTQRAYQALDLTLTNPKTQVNMPFNLDRGPSQKGEGWHLVNDLESPVFVWYPELNLFREKLKVLGALEARMTGSGSSIFGIFRERAMAEAAQSSLREFFPEWQLFVSEPVRWGLDDKVEEG